MYINKWIIQAIIQALEHLDVLDLQSGGKIKAVWFPTTNPVHAFDAEPACNVVLKLLLWPLPEASCLCSSGNYIEVWVNHQLLVKWTNSPGRCHPSRDVTAVGAVPRFLRSWVLCSHQYLQPSQYGLRYPFWQGTWGQLSLLRSWFGGPSCGSASNWSPIAGTQGSTPTRLAPLGWRFVLRLEQACQESQGERAAGVAFTGAKVCTGRAEVSQWQRFSNTIFLGRLLNSQPCH